MGAIKNEIIKRLLLLFFIFKKFWWRRDVELAVYFIFRPYKQVSLDRFLKTIEDKMKDEGINGLLFDTNSIVQSIETFYNIAREAKKGIQYIERRDYASRFARALLFFSKYKKYTTWSVIEEVLDLIKYEALIGLSTLLAKSPDEVARMILKHTKTKISKKKLVDFADFLKYLMGDLPDQPLIEIVDDEDLFKRNEFKLKFLEMRKKKYGKRLSQVDLILATWTIVDRLALVTTDYKLAKIVSWDGGFAIYVIPYW